ncbi:MULTISPECIES: hypothetical protein [Flavobacterium]|jgi:hypothetical protein|uniref:DUF3551 domain-containing protein n=1 Tax=Flavobacterium cupriresistens TaxID=2893885 RepID=A0ABU4RAC2_9FLAO|nr:MULTISPECIES: hypothetical protein [unclassified Flavobacterium]KLT69715.1 hypothetical protein AB674_10655 [Flavobacterium sp. ABG]MDX6189542.1 hypothetical protein [Flavobacterium sp. Fl-318]UFH41050.1 hypothetical protein LNP23_14660 [Flavobacterium sp. F-323]
MKHAIILLFVIFASFRPLETKVYICGPVGAKKYHYTENCRGLTACRHEITKVPVSKAQGYGLTLCGWED